MDLNSLIKVLTVESNKIKDRLKSINYYENAVKHNLLTGEITGIEKCLTILKNTKEYANGKYNG